ncbi:MAG: type 1 glutamine amidotransferase [Elusimicrobia bacterium]|nr:type 1 glutamine amidotransferase [Candidatus Liberimonas magnetica]
MIFIIKHAVDEGPGLLGKYLQEKNIKHKIIELEKGERLPKTTDGIEAVLIMGGPMNVYEEGKYPFLKYENDFIKDVFKNNKPLMGICLGAQLMAKAMGATVRKAKKEEIGWDKVYLSSRGIIDPLFSGVDSVIDVFQWHEDCFSVPKGAVLLAENSICPQAFKVGGNSYAFQFHIEVTKELLNSWARGIKSVDKENILAGLKEEYKKQAYKIFNNFCNIIP